MGVALRVNCDRRDGRPGDSVRVEVAVDRPDAVSSIRLLVPDEGLEEFLSRSGDAWTLASSVPWNAPPGSYRVVVQAYDRDFKLCGQQETEFTVMP